MQGHQWCRHIVLHLLKFSKQQILKALCGGSLSGFLASDQPLTAAQIIFATLAGLRGSVSLIMAQALVTDQQAREPRGAQGIPTVRYVTALGFQGLQH